MGVLTLIYTFEGIAAVIWTDLIQLVIYVAGSLLAAWLLLQAVPGGWPTIAADAASGGQVPVAVVQLGPHRPVHVLGRPRSAAPSSRWPRTAPTSCWCSGCSTCKNQRDSQKALVASGVIVFAQFVAVPHDRRDALRLLPARTGAADHEQRRDLPGVHRARSLPRGVAGLVIAAIARGGDVHVERIAELARVHDGISTSTSRSRARGRPTIGCSGSRAGARWPGASC
ncbi:MAG: hypothetical protein MZV65_01190 [Chromatiales bacterium]|nr:hypothetical protein [Chromatiales bacterium]